MAELRFVLLIWAEPDEKAEFELCPECHTTELPPVLRSSNLGVCIANMEYPFSAGERGAVEAWAKDAKEGDMLTCSDGTIAFVMSGKEALIRDETPPVPKKNFVVSYNNEDTPPWIPKKGLPKKLYDDPKKHPFCKQHPKLHDRVWVEGVGGCEVVKINFVAKQCVLEDNDCEIHKNIPFEKLRLP